MYIHACIQTYIYIEDLYIYMYTNIYIYRGLIYIYINIYASSRYCTINLYIYVCIHVCIYIYVGEIPPIFETRRINVSGHNCHLDESFGS